MTTEVMVGRLRDSVSHPVIVHLIGSFQRGGTETRLVETIEHLSGAGRGLATHFVLLSGESGPLAERAQAAGAEVHLLSLGACFPIRFFRLLRRLRPTCVHSHVHLASGPLLALSWAAGVPRRIAHFRSVGDGKDTNCRRRWRNRAYRRIVGMAATDVLAGTRAVLDTVFGRCWAEDRRYAVVGQGVRVCDFVSALDRRDPATKGVALLQVGRIDPEKNQLLTLQALHALRASRPDADLAFVGRPTVPYATKVERLARSAGLSESVSFMGERADVADVMADATVLVHPSIREGWPGVIVEARAAGLEVVAMDIPPIREIALEVGGVRLMARTDTPEAWADALSEALATGGDLDARRAHARRMCGGTFDAAHAAEVLFEYWMPR